MDPSLELAGRPRPWSRLDLGVTGALLVWAVAEAVVYTAGPPLWARLLFAMLWTLPLLVLRRHPVAVTLAVVGALLLWAVLARGTNVGFAPFPSMLVVSFGIGVRVRPPLRSLGLAAVPLAAMSLVTSTGFYDNEPSPGALAILLFFLGGAWALGRAVLQRAVQLEAEVDRAGQEARAAVQQERERIARELHDVVAHSLSIISVQSAAAEGLLVRDPARAAAHLAAVRGSAGEALVEMRRLVGVLRDDDASYAPQPSLARLDDLVEEARSAGLPVHVSAPAQPTALPAGVDLAAYRILQEALTNVRKHAGCVPTTVRVVQEHDRLHLEVVNDPGTAPPAAEGSGRGLVGMQERVRLYDGRLEAGPLASGGYSVRAELPVGSS